MQTLSLKLITNDMYIWDTVILDPSKTDGNTVFKYINYVSIFVATL